MKRPQEGNTGGCSHTQIINAAVSDYSDMFASNRTESPRPYKKTKQGQDTGPRATAESSGLLHTQQDLELCFGPTQQPSLNTVEGMVQWGTIPARLPLVEFSRPVLQLCGHKQSHGTAGLRGRKNLPGLLHLPISTVSVEQCCLLPQLLPQAAWMQGEPCIALYSLLLAIQPPHCSHPALQPSCPLRNALENHKTLRHKGRHQKSRRWDSTKSFILERWVTFCYENGGRRG